ncbi:hypothetical protein [Actinocorallia aurea]
MERRHLLQSLAALGAVSSPALDALADIQASLDRAVGGGPEAHLDDWEENVAEYGYTVLTTPPHELIPQLARDLVTVRTTMSRAAKETPAWRGWCRIVGGLSMVLAKALSSAQRGREARTWWTTAQQAADSSGDVGLSLWVSGEQLIHGLYERRPTPILLRRADALVERVGESDHRGYVTVLAARAQLHALSGPGHEADAAEAIERTASLFARLPTSITSERRSIVGWGEERLRYAETFVAAHLGDLDRLDSAAARTLTLIPLDQTRFRTQLKLLHGFGLVRGGDLRRGIDCATAAVEADPGARDSLMSAAIAGDILRELPASPTPEIAGYRELVAGSSST